MFNQNFIKIGKTVFQKFARESHIFWIRHFVFKYDKKNVQLCKLFEKEFKYFLLLLKYLFQFFLFQFFRREFVPLDSPAHSFLTSNPRSHFKDNIVKASAGNCGRVFRRRLQMLTLFRVRIRIGSVPGVLK